MTRRATPKGAVVVSKDEPTKPAAVAKGRTVAIDRKTAEAIAAANAASGFPPPAQLEHLLGAAATETPKTEG